MLVLQYMYSVFSSEQKHKWREYYSNLNSSVSQTDDVARTAAYDKIV